MAMSCGEEELDLRMFLESGECMGKGEKVCGGEGGLKGRRAGGDAWRPELRDGGTLVALLTSP